MSRDDGFAIMDLSTDYPNDPKWRTLFRASPDLLPVAFMAYTAAMCESWRCGHRVSVTESWPVILPFEQGAIDALRTAKLIDRAGLIVKATWQSWFDPASRRREDRRFEGMVGGLMKSLGLSREKAIEEALVRVGKATPPPRLTSGDPRPNLTRTVLSVPTDPARPPSAREIDALKERRGTTEHVGQIVTRVAR